MTIQTKYNMGDSLFFIRNNEILKRKIRLINVSIGEFNTSIEYEFLVEEKITMLDKDTICVRDEVSCFKTIEELTEYFKAKL
jgi:hypothetical protein